MREIMSTWHPDTVYHTAAYKHVPLVEHNPAAGIKNNVPGHVQRRQALEAAAEAGHEHAQDRLAALKGEPILQFFEYDHLPPVLQNISVPFYRLAYLLAASPSGAEDLLQTTLTKVYVGWRRVRAADDPVGYTHGILVKSFLSERRLRRSGELPVAETPEPSPRESTDIADRLTLMAALADEERFEEAGVHRDRLASFVRAAARSQRLTSLTRCPEVVAALREAMPAITISVPWRQKIHFPVSMVLP